MLKTKKNLSLILVLMMLLSVCPGFGVSAFAEGEVTVYSSGREPSAEIYGLLPLYQKDGVLYLDEACTAIWDENEISRAVPYDSSDCPHTALAADKADCSEEEYEEYEMAIQELKCNIELLSFNIKVYDAVEHLNNINEALAAGDTEKALLDCDELTDLIDRFDQRLQVLTDDEEYALHFEEAALRPIKDFFARCTQLIGTAETIIDEKDAFGDDSAVIYQKRCEEFYKKYLTLLDAYDITPENLRALMEELDEFYYVYELYQSYLDFYTFYKDKTLCLTSAPTCASAAPDCNFTVCNACLSIIAFEEDGDERDILGAYPAADYFKTNQEVYNSLDMYPIFLVPGADDFAESHPILREELISGTDLTDIPGKTALALAMICEDFYDEMNADGIVLPATGKHNFVEGVCTVCGAEDASGTDGHTCVFDQQIRLEEYLVSEATCDSPAIYYYSCVCGKKGTETFTYDCEHTWDDGVVTEAASCTMTGVMTYTCTVCGETKTEEIAELEHTPGEPEQGTVYQECLRNSWYEEYICCTECGIILDITYKELEPLGHIDADDDGICDRCGMSMSLIRLTSEMSTENYWLSTTDGDDSDDIFLYDPDTGLIYFYRDYYYQGLSMIYDPENAELEFTDAYKEARGYPDDDEFWANQKFIWLCQMLALINQPVPDAEFYDVPTKDEISCTDPYLYLSVTTDEGTDCIPVTYDLFEVKTATTEKGTYILGPIFTYDYDNVKNGFYIDSAIGKSIAYYMLASIPEEIQIIDAEFGLHDPTGHTPGEAVRENVVPATCKAAGSYDEVISCSVCGTELSRENKTLTKLTTHTWDEGSITTDPTCKTAGVMTCTCTVCGETKTEEIAKLTTHTPGEAKKENEKAASCTAAGSYDEVTYCTVCGTKLSSVTVPVNATGHSYAVVESYEPTCDSEGCIVRKCSSCDDVQQEIIAKLRHTDGNGDGLCDNCGTDLSAEQSACSHLCHKTGFLGFIWKIVNLFNKLFKINQYCTCGAKHW